MTTVPFGDRNHRGTDCQQHLRNEVPIWNANKPVRVVFPDPIFPAIAICIKVLWFYNL
jgi:hypothetical protein